MDNNLIDNLIDILLKVLFIIVFILMIGIAIVIIIGQIGLVLIGVSYALEHLSTWQILIAVIGVSAISLIVNSGE